MSYRSFPEITPGELWTRVAATILQWTRKGKLNCVGEVVLTAGTETTLTDQLLSPDSILLTQPHEAIVIEYVDTYDFGSCVIHHDTAAGTEVVRYAVIG